MTSNFGFITVLNVILALLASFIVFPAVIVLLDKHRESRKRRKDEHALHIIGSDGKIVPKEAAF
jgi:hypothetical protein